MSFLALWLACLMAVEITLLIYYAVLPVFGFLVLFVWNAVRSHRKDAGAATVREERWKHELGKALLTVIRWISAGALGCAVASGILLAQWLQ
jgi:heme/copper-type cytochrome/quinol oxidase subunit 2